MQDKTLTKISLITSLIGILILLLLLNIQQPPLFNIEDINEILINKNLQIQGNVIGIKNYEDFQILTVQDKTGKIPVLINTNNNQKILIKLNQQIIITGKVTEYNQNLQIQADIIIN